MLTDKGREIIGKFMISQIPSWATHIAIGCGAHPLGAAENQPATDQQRSRLEYEMARVPIIARGYVNDTLTGETRLFLKAELPAANRYSITEVGIWPAEADKIAGNYDSKQLATFTAAESWYYNSAALPEYTAKLDGSDETEIYLSDGVGGEYVAAYVTDDNAAWNNFGRLGRYEAPRNLGQSILIAGDSADIAADGSINSGKYIKTNNIVVDLSKNAPNDTLQLACALVARANNETTMPDAIRIVIDLLNEYSSGTTYAHYAGTVDVPAGADPSYIIKQIALGDFVANSETFSWANINGIRIYTSVIVDSAASNDYFMLYDGIRLEANSVNPLYGLVGYNVIRAEQPVAKRANSTNYIEFRMAVAINE